jgi:hypothetical protein
VPEQADRVLVGFALSAARMVEDPDQCRRVAGDTRIVSPYQACQCDAAERLEDAARHMAMSLMTRLVRQHAKEHFLVFARQLHYSINKTTVRPATITR